MKKLWVNIKLASSLKKKKIKLASG